MPSDPAPAPTPIEKPIHFVLEQEIGSPYNKICTIEIEGLSRIDYTLVDAKPHFSKLFTVSPVKGPRRYHIKIVVITGTLSEPHYEPPDTSDGYIDIKDGDKVVVEFDARDKREYVLEKNP